MKKLSECVECDINIPKSGKNLVSFEDVTFFIRSKYSGYVAYEVTSKKQIHFMFDKNKLLNFLFENINKIKQALKEYNDGI